MIFGLWIDNLIKGLQNCFFDLTNKIKEVIEFEKIIKEIKDEGKIKEQYNFLTENIKEIIKIRYIINAISEPTDNKEINSGPINYRQKFFDYFLNFAELLKNYKGDNNIKIINEYIQKNSLAYSVFIKSFPWDETKKSFELSGEIEFDKDSYQLFLYYEGVINDSFYDYYQNKKIDLFINKILQLIPILQQLYNKNVDVLDELQKNIYYKKIYFIIYLIQNVDFIEYLIPKLIEFTTEEKKIFIDKMSKEFKIKLNNTSNKNVMVLNYNNTETNYDLDDFNLEELYNAIKFNYFELNDEIQKYNYFNFIGLMKRNIFTNTNNNMKNCPYYFIINLLINIMKSNFICHLQDTCSFLDLFMGPGIYFYSIKNNILDSIKKIFMFPFYNDIQYIRKNKNILKNNDYMLNDIFQNIVDDTLYPKNEIKLNEEKDSNIILSNNFDKNNLINLPYSPKDRLTDRRIDTISISCYLKNVIIDSRIANAKITPFSLQLLFGTTRIVVILIHEMLGNLLKTKTSRITQRKIKPFTESNDNK